MRTQKYVIGLATLALGLSGLIVFRAPAQDSRPASGMPGGALAERAREKLGLTDEQLLQIQDVLRPEKSNIVTLLTRMRDARAGLRDAIRSDNANETTVRAAAAKVAVVEAAVAVERMKLFRQISPILTSDQRTKLAAMQANLDGFVDQAIQRIDARLGE